MKIVDAVGRFSRTVRRAAASRSAPRLVAVGAFFALAAALAAQGFGGGFRGRGNEAAALRGMPDRPAGFTFCRLMYTAVRSDPSGSGWAIEYPDAEFNFMTRLSQFTTTQISRWNSGEPGSTVIRASDSELFECPFLMVSSPGTLGLSDEDVAALREYLLKGGFLWGDDFWGEPSWAHWEAQIARVLPGYQLVDIPPTHPLFTAFYNVPEVPQIPSLNRWRPGRPTAELPGAVPHMRGVFDDEGRLMVLSTHNTDISDGWEREADLQEFFEQFAAKSYGVGINVAVWVMSH